MNGQSGDSGRHYPTGGNSDALAETKSIWAAINGSDGLRDRLDKKTSELREELTILKAEVNDMGRALDTVATKMTEQNAQLTKVLDRLNRDDIRAEVKKEQSEKIRKEKLAEEERAEKDAEKRQKKRERKMQLLVAVIGFGGVIIGKLVEHWFGG